MSSHAEKRSSQRGIPYEFVELTIKHGECIHRTGITFYIMTHRQLEQLSKEGLELPEKIAGIVVLCRKYVSGDMEIITVYKNPHALKIITKKQKRRFTCKLKYSRAVYS